MELPSVRTPDDSRSIGVNRQPSRPQIRGVVHVTEVVTGGVGAYLRNLLPLQRSTYGERAVCVVVPAGHAKEFVVPDGVEVFTFKDGPSRTENAVRLAFRAQSVVMRCRPEIVHIHSTFAGSVARLLLAGCNTRARVIYCPHGWAFERDVSPLARGIAKRAERWLSRFCDCIVCVSEYEREAARRVGIPHEKLRVIWNGVSATPPEAAFDPDQVPWPPGKRRVLFVGRFDYQKGADVFLAAMSRLEHCAFGWLVGAAQLHDMPLGALPRNVSLRGWASAAELEAYYRSADVVVVPSRWEAFGLTAIEAMRASRAVIASHVGGLSEVVEEAVTGLLVPANDSRALAEALRVTSDRALRLMGQAGSRRFNERFTLERMHAEICELYERMWV